MLLDFQNKMGFVFSRFKKKQTSLQALEGLEQEINGIENDRQTTMLRQKKYVGKLIIYSIFGYITTAAALYFFCFPSTLRDGAIYAAPLVLIPVIVILAKKILTWYFQREMSSKEIKLSDLRAKKKKILDEVMDKETFRVAKEILEKYAPDQLHKNMSQEKGTAVGAKEIGIMKIRVVTAGEGKTDAGETEGEKEGAVKGPERSLTLVPDPPSQVPQRALAVLSATPTPPPYQPQQFPQPPVGKRRLVRPVLPNQRGLIDRLIETLVGDGPSHRYALICANCSSHNGMALKDEFEYLSFRCTFCGFPNPARKVKPRESLSANSSPVRNNDTKKDPALMDTTSKEIVVGKNQPVITNCKKDPSPYKNGGSSDFVETSRNVGSEDRFSSSKTVVSPRASNKLYNPSHDIEKLLNGVKGIGNSCPRDISNEIRQHQHFDSSDDEWTLSTTRPQDKRNLQAEQFPKKRESLDYQQGMGTSYSVTGLGALQTRVWLSKDKLMTYEFAGKGDCFENPRILNVVHTASCPGLANCECWKKFR